MITATTLALISALLALAVGCIALIRTAKPPQTKQVHELAAQVADLQTAVDAFADRLTKRLKREGLETAREVHRERRAKSDAVLDEAERIIAATKGAGVATAAPVDDVEATRASLRARFLAAMPGRPQ